MPGCSKAGMPGCSKAGMPGCSKAYKHGISSYFRTSQPPNLQTSHSVFKIRNFCFYSSAALFEDRRSAPKVQRSFSSCFPSSRPHSLSMHFRTSQLPNLSTSIPLSLPASGPPSLPASQPPGLPAYNSILYFSRIAFSTSAGMHDFSSSARILFAISRARARASCDPFSSHFARLS